jgi:hypothetical protein
VRSRKGGREGARRTYATLHFTRPIRHLRSARVRRALAEKEATMSASAHDACVASTTTPPNLRNCPGAASSPGVGRTEGGRWAEHEMDPTATWITER